MQKFLSKESINKKKKAEVIIKMLLSLYIIVFILGWLFFGIGLYMGCNKDKLGINFTIKKGIIILFLMIGMIFFIITAYQSLNIETEHCFNCCNVDNTTSQQQVPPLLTGHIYNSSVGDTTIYNAIDCRIIRHSSEALAGFFSFMVIITLFLLLYYALQE